MSNLNWYDHQQHHIEQLQPIILPARPTSKRKIDWSTVFIVVVIVTLTLASLYLAFQVGRMTGAMEEQRAHVAKYNRSGTPKIHIEKVPPIVQTHNYTR